MAYSRSTTLIKEELIRYISSLDLQVNTVTKARGNRGFFKDGRIDISKTLDDDNAVKTIIHEFAHYINYKLDKKLDSIELLFGLDTPTLRRELLEVTKFVDKNAHCLKLSEEKDRLAENIKKLSDNIKTTYPKFSGNDELKEFNKYAKWSDLRYLAKYDRVKVNGGVSSKIYSVKTVKTDFPDMPEIFADYLQLRSEQRRRAKIMRRLNKLNKYYSEPCELFARFIEGLYLDSEKVKELAPRAYEQFLTLYNKNYYKCMRELFGILRIIVM